MITIKTREEFARMAVAGRTVAAMHAAIREAVRPGVSMRELDDIARKVLAANNCTGSFLGYGHPPFPGVICASPNDVIVHGIPGDYRLEEGDIVSIDAGAIFEGFHGERRSRWRSVTSPIASSASST